MTYKRVSSRKNLFKPTPQEWVAYNDLEEKYIASENNVKKLVHTNEELKRKLQQWDTVTNRVPVLWTATRGFAKEYLSEGLLNVGDTLAQQSAQYFVLTNKWGFRYELSAFFLLGSTWFASKTVFSPLWGAFLSTQAGLPYTWGSVWTDIKSNFSIFSASVQLRRQARKDFINNTNQTELLVKSLLEEKDQELKQQARKHQTELEDLEFKYQRKLKIMEKEL